MSVVALDANESLDASQDVVDAVVEFFFCWGRAPRVVVATSDDDLRIDLADELRARGFDVVEAAHARTLHAALLRAMSAPDAHAVDLLVVDAALDGCSPLHAIGYARQRGLSAAAVLLAAEDDPACAESPRLDLGICSRERARSGIDRALSRVLRERWSAAAVAA